VPRRIIEPSPELDRLARDTIGAAIEVHRVLGPGFLESVYEEALRIELTHRGLPFEPQVPVDIFYRSRPVGQCRMDLVIAGQLIVELKAVPQLLPIHVAQVISYLRASRRLLGLLINFDVVLLRAGVRRVALSEGRSA
jgi:GxxExxY protein